ncbi:MAG: family N-acetyltransferase [Caballeronia sp.]|jgi:CelD/BcsL family acetyltransferase involved in cellulose biosynthesis|nr:family N-acetyltransferase [Caballeronia sp.]
MHDRDLQYEIVSDETQFRALRDDWDALWSRANGRYYQAFSVCLLAWLHVAKPQGRRLRCLVCREKGRLVMVWPLVTYRRALWTYLLPLSPDAGDYTSVLVESNQSAAALIEGAWQSACRRCGADFMHLPYTHEGSELYDLARRHRRVVSAKRDDSWIAKLREETDWDAFCGKLGTLYGKKPGALQRRLSKEGELVIHMADPADTAGIATMVDRMLKWKRGWSDRVDKHGDWLESSQFQSFLVALLSAPDGHVVARLIVVSLDNAPIAGLIVTKGNPCANAIIGGFDEKYGKFGPGSIAVEHCVKWAFEQRFDLDFGVGSERFKSYWSNRNVSSAWTFHMVNTNWGQVRTRAARLARSLGFAPVRRAEPEEKVLAESS